ncbi:MAG: D-aminoacylase [Firmicutes bacterium]|nr:D-aminoacylase [Bacillota bacterium]
MYDGTGRPPFRADVLVARGKIAAIRPARVESSAASDSCEPGGSYPAPGRINAAGLAVCPGFIDIHSHSDKSLLINPLAESKVRQGVTTEVIGNCGYSLAPLTDRNRGAMLGEFERHSLDAGWATPGEYLAALEVAGISVNVLALVGHGAVRSAVMGYEMRRPSESEMESMKALVRQALDEGFVGISSGLIYPPGAYATTGELVELAREAARHGGFYASHIRGEREQVVDAVAEAIEIGRSSGAAVQISHHKAAGRPNWGKVSETLAMIERARNEGLDVTADQYPYTASATSLSAVLPGWVHAGGREAALARLRDPAVRARIEAEVEAREGAMRGWDEICITAVSSEGNRDLVGRFITGIAGERGQSPAVAVVSVLLEERMSADMIRFSISEEGVREVMKRPFVMVGSDGTALAPYGPLSRDRPHPRSYGTFPRVLGRYAVRERVIPLEEAIRKMTSLPAARLGLRHRGLIREGYAADVVVFDPAAVIDTATFEHPASYPEGIEYVVVNGKVTVARGSHLGERNGMVLGHSGR